MRPSADQRASRGDVSPQGLAVLRAAWRCDCDGVSHRSGGQAPAGPVATVNRHLDIIEEITGQRPPTCPWRAFYDPLVMHTMGLTIDADGGYAMATLGDDPAPLLVDALRIFRSARAAGARHVRRILDARKKPPGGRPGGGQTGFVSFRRGRRT